MYIKKIIDFEIDEEDIIDKLNINFDKDSSFDDVADAVYEYILDDDFDLSNFVDTFGGEEWLENEAVYPITEMFFEQWNED